MRDSREHRPNSLWTNRAAVPDGVVFIPFAYVEAAANLLTNPALDPFGMIPEFKYCAAKVQPASEVRVAAE